MDYWSYDSLLMVYDSSGTRKERTMFRMLYIMGFTGSFADNRMNGDLETKKDCHCHTGSLFPGRPVCACNPKQVVRGSRFALVLCVWHHLVG